MNVGQPPSAVVAFLFRPPKPAARPAADGEMIDDLAAAKHLVPRLGAKHVRRIVDLFD